MDYLEIQDKYNTDTLEKWEKMLFYIFKETTDFNKGKLALCFPEYYKAYKLIQINSNKG